MKNIATLTILILFALSTSAQDDSFKKFRFGLKVAPNISWLKPESASLDSKGVRLKFSYGLVTEFYFAENYGLSTGFELLTTGGKLMYQANSYIEPSNSTPQFFLDVRTFNLNYVLVPLNLKMKTDQIGYFTYFGQFGLNSFFRTASKADDLGVESTNLARSTTITDRTIIDETNLINLGLNLGLGTEYNLYKKTNLLVGINFNKGFTSVLRKKAKHIRQINSTEEVEQKSFLQYVSLNVGILF